MDSPRSPLRFNLPLLIALLISLGLSRPALAQTTADDAEVERLSNLALELAKGGRLEDAVQVWRALSMLVDESSLPDLELNLALAYRKLGRLAPAWHYFRRFVAARPQEARAAKELAAVEAQLATTHARVRFQCESTLVTLRFEDGEGASLWPCPLEWWLEPGDHRVAASVGDVFLVLPVRVAKERVDQRVVVPTISVPIEPAQRQAPMDGTASGLSVAHGDDVPTGALATLLVGAVALVAGGACHGWAYWDESELRKQYPDKGVPYATFLQNQAAYSNAYDKEVAPFVISSYVLYGVGAASLLGGLVWLVVGEPSLEPQPSLSVLPEGGFLIGIGW